MTPSEKFMNLKTTDIDTVEQDKRCQSCWYIVLSTMSGSTTVNDVIESNKKITICKLFADGAYDDNNRSLA
jgi:hypothetical protein